MLEMHMWGTITKGGEEDSNNDVSKSPRENHVQSKKTTIPVLSWVKFQYAIGFWKWQIADDHRDEDDANITTPTVVEQSDNNGFDLSSILLILHKLPLGVISKSSSGGGSGYNNNDETTQPCVVDPLILEKFDIASNLPSEDQVKISW